MNVKQLLGPTALALAAGTALAQDGSLTRAEVRQQVPAARAAGTRSLPAKASRQAMPWPRRRGS